MTVQSYWAPVSILILSRVHNYPIQIRALIIKPIIEAPDSDGVVSFLQL